jgi:uncharacterized protein YcfJ
MSKFFIALSIALASVLGIAGCGSTGETVGTVGGAVVGGVVGNEMGERYDEKKGRK